MEMIAGVWRSGSDLSLIKAAADEGLTSDTAPTRMKRNQSTGAIFCALGSLRMHDIG